MLRELFQLTWDASLHQGQDTAHSRQLALSSLCFRETDCVLSDSLRKLGALGEKNAWLIQTAIIYHCRPGEATLEEINMQIQDLKQTDELLIQQAAQLLCEAFKHNWPKAWPTLADALAEVREFFAADRIARVAVDDTGALLGWLGGTEMYDGNVWELHPLAVRPDLQGQGIGRALVTDLEAQVAARGATTLWLGTDDENGMTSLADADLYPNVWEHLAHLRNLRRHPFEFYQKLGFVVVGVMPDANGLGKPDIFMAKRVRR